MSQLKLPRILCVDDEPRVLDSLVVTLRREFEVHVATSGEAALELLKSSGPFAVICSDMRMPAMNGAALLKIAMDSYPETTRVLLTGEPGRDAAVDAVNEGQIFRFLTKPCPPDRLKAALDAAVKHHELVSAERILLQQTLVGCIQALVDVLAIANPIAFGRANRVKRTAMEFAAHLGYGNPWQLEAAAMLSQIGYLALPIDLVEKLYYGHRLTDEEQSKAAAVPQVAQRLLANIPRLEPVLQILAAVEKPCDLQTRQDTVAISARTLALTLDYDAFIAQGVSTEVALGMLQKLADKHDPAFIAKFIKGHGKRSEENEVRQLQLRMVRTGMTFMDDLRSEFGVLLVPRGFEVTDSFCERMRNFSAPMLNESVRVMVRGQGTESQASNVA
jgi:response regulator RpfG family c-di-GMP phosphodiesterase